MFEQTEHFVHEFVSFAQSPYDMVAYDDKAEYDVPADGTDLPQLLPVDEEEPGMTCSLFVSLYASATIYQESSLLFQSI